MGIGVVTAERTSVRTVARLLTERGLTLSVAESCTGGLLAGALTSVAGSSAYFPGGVTAYANGVKSRLVGVRSESLATHGAVSHTVALEMACGVRARLGTEVGVGVTGIAGPGGGTATKPVGLVYVAVAHGGKVRSKRHLFDGSRAVVRRKSVAAALRMIEEALTGAEQEVGGSEHEEEVWREAGKYGA